MHTDRRITEYLLILKCNHNAIIKDISDSALQIEEKSKISLTTNLPHKYIFGLKALLFLL